MKIKYLLPLAITCGLVSQSHAEVLTDVTRTAGAGAISPNQVIDFDASGSTAQTTLEGLTGFSAIHDYAFTGNATSANDYIFSFTDSSVADVKLNYTGNVGSGVNLTSSGWNTSDGSVMRVQLSNQSSTVSLTAQLGSYNAGTSTWSDFDTAGQGVAALGFTFSGSRWNTITAAGVDILYKDAEGNTLSTQNIARDASAAALQAYSGYQSAGAPIASVTLTYTGDSESSQASIFGFDDFGTTAAIIPEPSSFALLSGCLALGAIMIRRRRA